MRRALYLIVGTFTILGVLFVTVPVKADLFTDQKTAVQKALTWLKSQQNDDGGFGISGYSGAYITTQAVLAITAANEDPNTWLKGSRSPMDFLRDNVSGYTTTGGQTGLLICAVVAGSGNPRDFGGTNLIDKLGSQYDSSSGKYSGLGVSDQGWAMLGLAAAMETIPGQAVTWLKGQQQAGGNWTYSDPNPKDVDITARAMQALMAAGEPPTSTVMISATNYLSTTQSTTDSGMPQRAGQESNANSTAYTIQALIARGENPLGAVWSKSSNPLTFLMSMQQADGSFKWMASQVGDTLLATVQAIPALMGKPFPIRGRKVAALKAYDYMKAQQNANGSFAGFVPEDTGATLDAVFAIVGNCEDPHDWKGSSGESPIDFLATEVVTYTTTGFAPASQTGKMIMGLVAAEENPMDFAGTNLFNVLEDYYSPTVKYYADGVGQTTWALMALKAAGRPMPADAVDWLKNAQDSSGGWGSYTPPYQAPSWCGPVTVSTLDAAQTALTAYVLVLLGESPTSSTIQNALNFLRQHQNNDGGFRSKLDMSDPCLTDLNSESMVTKGVIDLLMLVGQDPLDWSWTKTLTGTSEVTMTINSMVDNFLELQQPDGSFPWKAGIPGSAAYAYQAFLTLSDKLLPVVPCSREAYLPLTLMNANSTP